MTGAELFLASMITFIWCCGGTLSAFTAASSGKGLSAMMTYAISSGKSAKNVENCHWKNYMLLSNDSQTVGSRSLSLSGAVRRAIQAEDTSQGAEADSLVQAPRAELRSRRQGVPTKHTHWQQSGLRKT